MTQHQTSSKQLMVSILSLSLLTVMAGAAVAPALGVIQAYFADSNPLFVQMVISVPAIFIVITNFFLSTALPCLWRKKLWCWAAYCCTP